MEKKMTAETIEDVLERMGDALKQVANALDIPKDQCYIAEDLVDAIKKLKKQASIEAFPSA